MVRPHWLLAGVPCALLLAILNPHLAGKTDTRMCTQRSAHTSPHASSIHRACRLYWTEEARGAAVFLIFLSSGVRVEGSALLAAWRNRRTVLFVQGCGFLVVPVLVKLITLILRAFDANAAVLQGVMTIACMPPAVSSGVVLTRAARADEAAAVVSAALGSLLAVLLTPLLLLCTCGSTTLEPISRLPLRPFTTVLLPLALGRLLAKPLCGYKYRWGWSVEVILLLLLYGSCCDSLLETQGELDANHVLFTVILVLGSVVCSAALCRRLGSALLPPADAATCLLCVTQKSLGFALPRLHVLYSGGPLLTLPLLVHQPAQLLLGTVLAVHLRGKEKLPR